MNIILLSHARELNKNTNTGVLVKQVLADKAQVIIWQRVQPDLKLLETIKNQSVVLLFPCDEAELLSDDISKELNFDHCIIIDSTWQEAQKIYNKSPYLKALKKIKIESNKKSIYTLRRNQKKTGLCTAECVIELLNFSGDEKKSIELENRFKQFLVSQ